MKSTIAFRLYRCGWGTVGAAFLVSAWSAAASTPAPDALESARSAVRLKQFDRALTELRKQADIGNTEAQYLLGLALLNGLTKRTRSAGGQTLAEIGGPTAIIPARLSRWPRCCFAATGRSDLKQWSG